MGGEQARLFAHGSRHLWGASGEFRDVNNVYKRSFSIAGVLKSDRSTLNVIEIPTSGAAGAATHCKARNGRRCVCVAFLIYQGCQMMSCHRFDR